RGAPGNRSRRMPKAIALTRASGPPILGNMLRLVRDPIGFTMGCARRYGDLADLNVPILPIYIVSDPELIEEVLVRDQRSYRKDRRTRALSEVLGGGLGTSEGDPGAQGSARSARASVFRPTPSRFAASVLFPSQAFTTAST